MRVLTLELLEVRRNAAADLDAAISNLQAKADGIPEERFCRPASPAILERVGPNTLMFDVDGDGLISTTDAQLIIEKVDSERVTVDLVNGPLLSPEAENSENSLYQFDVNRDGSITPSDALMVINRVHFFNELVPCTCSGCLANVVVDGV